MRICCAGQPQTGCTGPPDRARPMLWRFVRCHVRVSASRPAALRGEACRAWPFCAGGWIAVAEASPPGRNNRKIRRDWADSFLDRDYTKRRRTGNLARWNSLLPEHLDTDRAQRLAGHTAFGGPEADFLKAQAARLRGDLDEARALITECLKHLPGSTEFAAFAEEVGAEVPP